MAFVAPYKLDRALAQTEHAAFAVVLPEYVDFPPRKPCPPAVDRNHICIEPTPPMYALVVRHKDRIVRLTAEQIMDALEGKD